MGFVEAERANPKQTMPNSRIATRFPPNRHLGSKMRPSKNKDPIIQEFQDSDMANQSKMPCFPGAEPYFLAILH